MPTSYAQLADVLLGEAVRPFAGFRAPPLRFTPTSALLIAAAAANAVAVAVATPVQPGAALPAATSVAPATTSANEMDQVRRLLRMLRLEKYAGAFAAAGYDDADFLMQLSAEDAQRVAQTVGMKPGHAHKFGKLLLTSLRTTRVSALSSV